MSSSNYNPQSVISTCDGRVGYEQEKCSGRLYADGQVMDGCGEPCRFSMRKSGEGNPPIETPDFYKGYDQGYHDGRAGRTYQGLLED